MYRIVVDAMGSDSCPEPEIRGALRAVAADADLRVTLVGNVDVQHDRIAVVRTDQIVTMDDHAVASFRAKPRSTMRRAVELVAAGEGDAVVSAGNSGALLACAIFVLGKSPGVDRPAIVTSLPSKAPLVLCDAGANVDPKPSMLVQFAKLGIEYARRMHGIAVPRVGVLSNGGEPSKGTALTRGACELLAGSPGFVGYVEGHDLFHGVVDVVATDGFTGNVVLKTVEGLVGSGYTEVGGALLAGVARTVVLAHGRSDAIAIGNAILTAARFSRP